MNAKVLIGSIVLGVLVFPAMAFAQNECRADIRGELMRKETGDVDTKYTAEVTVSARQNCAMVDFELIVVEVESGGEEFVVRIPKRIRVRDSSESTMSINYTLKKGRNISTHRLEQTGCEICE